MYHRQIKYSSSNDHDITIRELLKKWLIPKKWQHFFRIQQDVLINGEYHPFNTIVKNNDLVTLNFNFPPRSQDQTYLPGHHKVEVCYENDDIIVVNKRAGIKSHPNLKTENDSLMNDVETYLTPQHPYMVHRIDMETSGLVLICKTPYLVPIFNQQLSSKSLHREYLAIVDLNSPIIQKHGVIKSPIGLDPNDKRKRMVRQDGQDAITEYEVIKQNKKYALLRLNLLTGRTHQLRVHLSSKKWPIINDLLYNNEPKNGNLMLFAHELNFIKPFSDDIQTVEADLPDFMTDFITNMF